jgi:hypothetical protein
MQHIMNMRQRTSCKKLNNDTEIARVRVFSLKNQQNKANVIGKFISKEIFGVKHFFSFFDAARRMMCSIRKLSAFHNVPLFAARQ